MIEVTRLNGSKFMLNPELFMTIEAHPDTVITLTNGEKWVVSDSPKSIQGAFIHYQRQVHQQQLNGESL